jgi:hypothetical protein
MLRMVPLPRKRGRITQAQLLDKQKKGKKRIRRLGKVDIPHEAFIHALSVQALKMGDWLPILPRLRGRGTAEGGGGGTRPQTPHGNAKSNANAWNDGNGD